MTKKEYYGAIATVLENSNIKAVFERYTQKTKRDLDYQKSCEHIEQERDLGGTVMHICKLTNCPCDLRCIRQTNKEEQNET